MRTGPRQRSAGVTARWASEKLARVQCLPGGEGYRYYQPLRVQPFCVQCHGASGELAEGVADVLAEPLTGGRGDGLLRR